MILEVRVHLVNEDRSWDLEESSQNTAGVLVSLARCTASLVIADRLVLGLAHAPDVPVATSCSNTTVRVGGDNLDDAVRGNLEGLVVQAYSSAFFAAETDVCDAAWRTRRTYRWPYGRGYPGLEHAGVGSVGVRQTTSSSSPSCSRLAAVADHRRHGRVDDDVQGTCRLVIPLSESTMATLGRSGCCSTPSKSTISPPR